MPSLQDIQIASSYPVLTGRVRECVRAAIGALVGSQKAADISFVKANLIDADKTQWLAGQIISLALHASTPLAAALDTKKASVEEACDAVTDADLKAITATYLSPLRALLP